MLDRILFMELENYIKLNMDRSFEDVYFPDFEIRKQDSIRCEEVGLLEFIEEEKEANFSEKLFEIIDSKGLDEVEVYKRARVDRRHFSKIRSDINYKVGKNTVIAFAIALELDEDMSDDLLNSAGFTLSNSNKFDLIIKFFIAKGLYDIDLINEALYDFNEKPLIGVVK